MMSASSTVGATSTLLLPLPPPPPPPLETQVIRDRIHLMAYTGDILRLSKALERRPELVNCIFDFSQTGNLLSRAELAAKLSGRFLPPPSHESAARAREGIDKYIDTNDVTALTVEQRWVLAKQFNQSSLLHYAALGDQREAVKMLIKLGAPLLQANNGGLLPETCTTSGRIRELITKHLIDVLQVEKNAERKRAKNPPAANASMQSQMQSQSSAVPRPILKRSSQFGAASGESAGSSSENRDGRNRPRDSNQGQGLRRRFGSAFFNNLSEIGKALQESTVTGVRTRPSTTKPRSDGEGESGDSSWAEQQGKGFGARDPSSPLGFGSDEEVQEMRRTASSSKRTSTLNRNQCTKCGVKRNHHFTTLYNPKRGFGDNFDKLDQYLWERPMEDGTFAFVCLRESFCYQRRLALDRKQGKRGVPPPPRDIAGVLVSPDSPSGMSPASGRGSPLGVHEQRERERSRELERTRRETQMAAMIEAEAEAEMAASISADVAPPPGPPAIPAAAAASNSGEPALPPPAPAAASTATSAPTPKAISGTPPTTDDDSDAVKLNHFGQVPSGRKSVMVPQGEKPSSSTAEVNDAPADEPADTASAASSATPAQKPDEDEDGLESWERKPASSEVGVPQSAISGTAAIMAVVKEAERVANKEKEELSLQNKDKERMDRLRYKQIIMFKKQLRPLSQLPVEQIEQEIARMEADLKQRQAGTGTGTGSTVLSGGAQTTQFGGLAYPNHDALGRPLPARNVVDPGWEGMTVGEQVWRRAARSIQSQGCVDDPALMRLRTEAAEDGKKLMESSFHEYAYREKWEGLATAPSERAPKGSKRQSAPALISSDYYASGIGFLGLDEEERVGRDGVRIPVNQRKSSGGFKPKKPATFGRRSATMM